MSWHTVSAAGRARDLWVRVTGDSAPRYGRWVTPGGLDVANVLGEQGPTALDIAVWWVPEPDHSGRQLTDMLWQTDLLGLKLVSRRMLEVLQKAGARLEMFDVNIRLHRNKPLTEYVGVLEDCQEPGPVHSLWRGRRSHRLVVSDHVVQALEGAGLAGLTFTSVDRAFPADQPGFFEED